MKATNLDARIKWGTPTSEYVNKMNGTVIRVNGVVVWPLIDAEYIDPAADWDYCADSVPCDPTPFPMVGDSVELATSSGTLTGEVSHFTDNIVYLRGARFAGAYVCMKNGDSGFGSFWFSWGSDTRIESSFGTFAPPRYEALRSLVACLISERYADGDKRECYLHAAKIINLIGVEF